MGAWKFVESDDDGHAWMQNPSELHAFVDVQSRGVTGHEEWRRIMVVTKGWVERQLASMRAASERAVFPAMLVVADASSSELRASIEAAVSSGGLEHFASPVE